MRVVIGAGPPYNLPQRLPGGQETVGGYEALEVIGKSVYVF